MRRHIVIGLLGATLMAGGVLWPTTEVSYAGNTWAITCDSLEYTSSIQVLS